MFKVRNLVVVCLVLVALAVPAIGTASAQSSNEKPKATEVGVSASEIHIGVVADVDNPFAPGLFQGAVDGVKAGAAYLNSKAGGGGTRRPQDRRRLLRLEAQRQRGAQRHHPGRARTTTRSSAPRRCSSPRSTTSSTAPDQAGAATGIPDLSAVTTGVPESCSPMAFPAFGTQIDCATVNDNPQTFNVNQGPPKHAVSTSKTRSTV